VFGKGDVLRMSLWVKRKGQ